MEKRKKEKKLNHDDVTEIMASLLAPLIVLSDIKTVREVLCKITTMDDDLWQQMSAYVELVNGACVLDEHGIIHPVKVRDKEDLQ